MIDVLVDYSKNSTLKLMIKTVQNIVESEFKIKVVCQINGN